MIKSFLSTCKSRRSWKKKNSNIPTCCCPDLQHWFAIGPRIFWFAAVSCWSAAVLLSSSALISCRALIQICFWPAPICFQSRLVDLMQSEREECVCGERGEREGGTKHGCRHIWARKERWIVFSLVDKEGFRWLRIGGKSWNLKHKKRGGHQYLGGKRVWETGNPNCARVLKSRAQSWHWKTLPELHFYVVGTCGLGLSRLKLLL